AVSSSSTESQDAGGDAPPVHTPKAEEDPVQASPAGANLEETDEAFQARLEQRQREHQALRASTPPQVVQIRPTPRQDLLGMVVIDGQTGKVLRTARLAHYRTEQVTLAAGERAYVVVLVGHDLE